MLAVQSPRRPIGASTLAPSKLAEARAILEHTFSPTVRTVVVMMIMNMNMMRMRMKI
jgi:hypothetical protein